MSQATSVKLNSNSKQAQEVRSQYENLEVGLERRGTKIILPDTPAEMTLDEGIQCLLRLKKQEEAEVAINEEVDALPYEGAVAFIEALRRIYGWVNPVPTPGFFGPRPPHMVGVEVGPGQFIQVPWGRIEIPGIEGYLNTSGTEREGLERFVIGGVVRQKFIGQVRKIAELTRQIVREESIYRGKALRLNVDEDSGDVNFNNIKFLDLSGVNEEELVYPETVMEQVKVNLFTPLEHTQVCRDNHIPLNTSVLFEGPFGTGKTLGAYVAAKKGVANGWTFIYLSRASGLKEALLFAKKFQPALIFAEDIDRVTSGDRDEETDDILNTIDGVDTKGCEIITVLTTNEVTKINKAMLRPGRLDAVITIGAPDAEAVNKLIRIYSKGQLAPTEDLTAVGKELQGQIPATIREVVERSKKYSVRRGTVDGKLTITADDLLRSAQGMKMHLELLNRDDKRPATAGEKLAEALTDLTHAGMNGMRETVDFTRSKVEEIHQRLN